MKSKKISALVILSMTSILFSCGQGYSKTNSITFMDGDTSLGTISGEAGTKVSDDDKTKISGYESKTDQAGTVYQFSGWYAKSDFSGNASKCTYYPYSDMTVYAKFLTQVTITLKNEDSSVKATYTGISGEQITVTVGTGYDAYVGLVTFPTLTKDNYTFSGWYYTDSEGTETKFTSNIYPETNLVLTPKFTPWPSLSFVTNVEGKTVTSTQFEPGKNISLSTTTKTQINDAISTKTASGVYKFDKWYSAYNADTGVFSSPFDLGSVMPSTDTTVYAKYFTKHTLSFVTGIENYTIASSNYFEGDVISAPIIDQVKLPAGKHFVGWYTDQAYTSDVYSFTTMPGEDLTLYGKVEDNPTLTLKDGTDSSVLLESYVYESGNTVDLSTYEKDHTTDTEPKDFVSWSTSNDITDTSSYIASPSTYIMPSTDTVLYALYKNEYKLTIHHVDLSLTTLADDTSMYLSSTIPSSLAKPSTISSSYSALKVVKSIDSTSTDYLKEIALPYPIDADKEIYVIYAKKVTLTIKAAIYNTTTSTVVQQGDDIKVEGLQESKFTSSTVSVNSTTAKYEILGNATTIDSSTYTLKRFYVDGNESADYDIGSYMPDADITIYAVFILKE